MATEALTATFKIIDQATASLRAVREQLGLTETQAKRTGEQIETVGLRTRLAELNKGLGVVRRSFGLLGATAESTFSRITRYLPVLGGLGALASASSIMSMLDKVAESRMASAAMAQRVGVNPGSMNQYMLGSYGFAARMTGVDPDAVPGALMRLQANIAEGAAGRNKRVMAVFRQLHFSLTNKDGTPRDLGEVMQRLQLAFSRTRNAQTKIDVARVLFGRGGPEMLPMLQMPPAEMQALLARGKGLTYSFTPEDNQNAIEYRRSMILLQGAVAGVKNAIAAQLFPVLRPVIDMFTQWLAVNREWIATGVKQAIIEISTYLSHVDWRSVGDELLTILRVVRRTVDAFGGFVRVLEGLAAIKILGWLGGIAGGFMKVAEAATAAGRAIGLVRPAAVSGAATAAAEGGASGAAAGMAGGSIGAVLAALARFTLRWAGPVGTFLYLMHPKPAGESDEEKQLTALGKRPSYFPTGAELSHNEFIKQLPPPPPLVPTSPYRLSDQKPLEDLRRARGSGLGLGDPVDFPYSGVPSILPGSSADQSSFYGGLIRHLLGLDAVSATTAPADKVKVDLSVSFQNAPAGMTATASQMGGRVNSVTIDYGQRRDN